jgi:hypothetical protein
MHSKPPLVFDYRGNSLFVEKMDLQRPLTQLQEYALSMDLVDYATIALVEDNSIPNENNQN